MWKNATGIFGIFGVVVLCLTVGARAAEAPTVAEVDRLRVQNLAQAMEIAQLRAQAAQRDYDQARASLATLAQQLQREGYTLDLQTLTYRPTAP